MSLTRREFLRDVAAALAAGGAAAMAPGILRAAGTSAPDGAECPIEHIVVLTMENRSFDHYFGSLSLDEGRTDVDGIVRDAGGALPSNPWLGATAWRCSTSKTRTASAWTRRTSGSRRGSSTRREPTRATCARCNSHHNDPPEPDARQPGMENVMGYYTRPQLPFLYSAADEFTICDRHFSPVGAPTLPTGTTCTRRRR